MSALACAAANANAAEALPRETEEFFEREVRPTLLNHCVACHGSKAQEAGLRLDSRDYMMRGVEGHPILVPGHPERSMLIDVTKYDGEVQMPPDGKLPEKDLAILVKWVKLGAPWPEAKTPEDASPAPVAAPDMDARDRKARAEHWAFQPVRRPPLPQVQDERWCRSPVDRFVLARLEHAGLRASPAADKRTLLRRATFDLTGLPPTMAEIEAFEQDRSPEAFAKVVERLLASPAYGERWGRHWLDVARYADTKGYVFTQDGRYPYAYTYRDYVVRAFNEDRPYNRFVLEQLAADQLSLGDDKRPLAALGFLTVGRRFGNNMQDVIDDRIDVVTRGLLGLTVACARCHDHKYDAVPTDDYYSLYGVFASSTEPEELPVISQPADTPEYRQYLAELGKLEAEVEKYREEHRVKFEEQLRTHPGDFLAGLLIERAKRQPEFEPIEYKFAVAEPRPTFLRPWRDFLFRGPIKEGPFALWGRFASIKRGEFAARSAAIMADLAKEAKAAESAGKPGAGKPAHLATNRLLREAFLKSPPKSMADVIRLYDHVLTATKFEWERLEAKRDVQQKGRPLADPAAEELRMVLLGPDSPATLTTREADGLINQGEFSKLMDLKGKVNSFIINSPASPPRAMVLADAPQPMEPRVLVRGNAGRPGKKVPRQFLRILSPENRQPFKHGSGRLELAEAIVSPGNPLTSRVLVNRVWMHHFGAGLVNTASDFGIRSELPSHPELLDYLASTFVEEGWSIKKLHRSIMLSSTYQQASDVRADAAAIDPDNRLLARMNRRRLEFEALRDSILAVSGSLDRTVGGRAVDLEKPPLPTRRTLYGLVDRQDLPGMFRVFDFASPDVSTEERPRTTVPQQALFVMNSPLVLEQARKLAGGSAGKPPSERIAAIYRQVLAREPSAGELELAAKFVARQEAVAKSASPAVRKAAPQRGKPAAVPPKPLEPWEMYAQVLLLTNEFIFID